MTEEILQQLEKDFSSLRKEYKIKSSLEDINKIFSIKDIALKESYIPTELIKTINRGMIDSLHSWASYLHGLLVPNPQHMISMFESQFFDEKERNEIFKLLSETMIISSKTAMLNLKNNKQENARLTDEIVVFWEKVLNPKLEVIMKKVHDSWVEKSKSKK